MLLRTSKQKNTAIEKVLAACAEKKPYLPLAQYPSTSCTRLRSEGSLQGRKRSTLGLTMPSAIPSASKTQSAAHATTSTICPIVSLFFTTRYSKATYIGIQVKPEVRAIISPSTNCELLPLSARRRSVSACKRVSIFIFAEFLSNYFY